MNERTGAATALEIESPFYEEELSSDLSSNVSALHVKPDAEVVEGPTFEALFAVLREARLARQTLVTRKGLPSWATLNPVNKRNIEEILESSEEIRGHIKLPNELPPLRINRASELIEAGKKARSAIFQRLRDFIQPQIEEEFGEHARDLGREVDEAIRQVIVSGRIDDEREIKSSLKKQFGITGEAKIREVKSVMTGEEIQKYEENVQKHIARLRERLITSGVDLRDAAQEARLAVLEAINNYNPELGKFPPYLFTIINGRLHDLMRATSPMTRSEQRNLRVISEFEQAFESEKGRTPTIGEIEVATGIDREEIRALMAFPKVFTVADLQENLIEKMENSGHEGLRDSDLLVEPEGFLLEQEQAKELISMRDRLMAALDLLKKRDRTILEQYYFEGIPFWKIGENVGLSESRSSQLHKMAIARLKKILTTGISLKEFLAEIGISHSVFYNNGFGDGLEFQHVGRGGARLGPIEMRTIKERAEAHRRHVIEEREARRKAMARRIKTEKSKKSRAKKVKQAIKNRLNGKNPNQEQFRRDDGRRPTEYKPILVSDLEILLELYGDQLKEKEIRVLKLRSGLEDGILWTLEETAVALGYKTAPSARYYEQRGLAKLRELEPAVFAVQSF